MNENKETCINKNSICSEKLYENLDDKLLTKKQSYALFDSILLKSGFSIDKKILSSDSSYYIYKISIGSLKYTLNVLLKNICQSGWKDKPYVKRIQIQPFSIDVKTKKNTCFILGGIANYKGENILVVWNPLRYAYHKTFRSAYVYVNSIDKAYNEGLYVCNDYENDIFLCSSSCFMNLLKSYYDYSYTEEIEW